MTENDFMDDIFGELGFEENKEEEGIDIEEMLKPS